VAEGALKERGFYLLSELGKDLGADLRTLKDLTKQTLSNFVSDRFSDKFTIVLIGEFKNVQALVRSATSMVEPEPVILSDQVILERKVITKAPPRFNYRFWAAFSVPLREGRRFLNLSDFTFEDISSGEAPEGNIEIPSSLIAAPDIQDRDKQIAANIQRWIEQNGLNQADFYQSKFPKGAVPTRTTGTVLEALIAALDHRQLSSTSLSLDVIAALSSHK
jgi:hypothetical protein